MTTLQRITCIHTAILLGVRSLWFEVTYRRNRPCLRVRLFMDGVESCSPVVLHAFNETEWWLQGILEEASRRPDKRKHHAERVFDWAPRGHARYGPPMPELRDHQIVRIQSLRTVWSTYNFLNEAE